MIGIKNGTAITTLTHMGRKYVDVSDLTNVFHDLKDQNPQYSDMMEYLIELVRSLR